MSDKGVAAENARADYDDSTGRKSDLLAAFEAVEAKAAPVPETKPAVAAAPEPKPEDAPETETPEGEQPEGEEKPEAEAKAAPELEPPKNWTKARQEQFRELPDPAKRILLDRFKEMDADYSRKTTEIAEQRKLYGAVEDIFTPYKDQMRQAGYTPEAAVRAWAQAEVALSNPTTRDQAFKELARAYKFDLAKLTDDVQRAAPVVDPNDQEAVAKAQLDQLMAPYLTPAQEKIKALEEKIAGLTATQTRTQNNERQSAEQRVMSEINSFIEAKDASGNSLHPYFADVENDMALMAAGFQRMSQPVPPLEELYQRAVRANPVTYERLTAADRNAAEAKAKEAARAKSAQAKRAGSSVTGAAGTAQPRNGHAPDDAPTRELISRAYDDLMSSRVQ